MPITYAIIDGIIIVTCTDLVVDSEALIAQHDMFHNAAFRGTYPRLIDATGVTDWQITYGMVRHCAQCAVDRGLRRAALVSSDSLLVTTMMRLYAQYSGDAEVEVFLHCKAATNWLQYRKTMDAAGHR